MIPMLVACTIRTAAHSKLSDLDDVKIIFENMLVPAVLDGIAAVAALGASFIIRAESTPRVNAWLWAAVVSSASSVIAPFLAKLLEKFDILKAFPKASRLAVLFVNLGLFGLSVAGSVIVVKHEETAWVVFGVAFAPLYSIIYSVLHNFAYPNSDSRDTVVASDTNTFMGVPWPSFTSFFTESGLRRRRPITRADASEPHELDRFL